MPRLCFGVVAVIVLALATKKLVAAVPPNATAVAPVKLVPEIVTLVPPVDGPRFGLMLVIVGCDAAKNVKALLMLLVPPAVVTATSAAPAACAGVVAVIVEALTTITLVAALPPMVTAVAPVKLVPVIVTLVPPAVVPLFGATAVTVGAGVT